MYSNPDADQAGIRRMFTGSRLIVTIVIIVVLLALIGLLGWRLATRGNVGHFNATGQVLSVDPATGTFSMKPAGPNLPSNGSTSVKISQSTVFQICRAPAASGATPQGCSSASSTAVKAGEQVKVVATVSNNTFTATQVQVL